MHHFAFALKMGLKPNLLEHKSDALLDTEVMDKDNQNHFMTKSTRKLVAWPG